MSVALYIVLEREDPCLESYVDGRALSRAEAELMEVAKRLGVTPLMDFFSMDPEEMLAEAQEFNTGLTTDTVPAEAWFAPADGLRTVRALRQYVDTNEGSVTEAASVANELVGFEHVLEEAERRGIRWHLGVDY